MQTSLKILGIIFVIFFLLNIEFFQATVGAPHQTSISLGDELPKYPYYDDPEIGGATWLLENMNKSFKVYGDYYGVPVFLGYLPEEFVVSLRGNKTQVSNLPFNNAYIYLTYTNLKSGEIVLWVAAYQHETVDLYTLSILDLRPKIYSNGYSDIYGDP
jgi:uncharacterized membrane protein